MPDDFLFADREEAALLLSKRLVKYKGGDAIVLAVPRGGVPLGAVIARQLDLPLDVVLVKKLGHPRNPEYAIGSVSLRAVRIDRPSIDVTDDYVQKESYRIRQELERRKRVFMGGDKATYPIENKTVILVDDGIATGSTLLAAIGDVREAGAARIVVAVPVAPPSASEVCRNASDEYIVLHEPIDFNGVGQFYADFGQVSDEEVASILDQYRKPVQNQN